jgi:hypothetical protein
MTGQWQMRPDRSKPWTPIQCQRAIALRRANLSYEAIAREMGGLAGTTVRERIMRMVARDKLQGMPDIVPQPKRPPDKECPHAIAARDLRYAALAHRALSAVIFGDPPPGYSALDGKVGMT